MMLHKNKCKILELKEMITDCFLSAEWINKARKSNKTNPAIHLRVAFELTKKLLQIPTFELTINTALLNQLAGKKKAYLYNDVKLFVEHLLVRNPYFSVQKRAGNWQLSLVANLGLNSCLDSQQKQPTSASNTVEYTESENDLIRSLIRKMENSQDSVTIIAKRKNKEVVFNISENINCTGFQYEKKRLNSWLNSCLDSCRKGVSMPCEQMITDEKQVSLIRNFFLGLIRNQKMSLLFITIESYILNKIIKKYIDNSKREKKINEVKILHNNKVGKPTEIITTKQKEEVIGKKEKGSTLKSTIDKKEMFNCKELTLTYNFKGSKEYSSQKERDKHNELMKFVTNKKSWYEYKSKIKESDIDNFLYPKNKFSPEKSISKLLAYAYHVASEITIFHEKCKNFFGWYILGINPNQIPKTRGNVTISNKKKEITLFDNSLKQDFQKIVNTKLNNKNGRLKRLKTTMIKLVKLFKSKVCTMKYGDLDEGRSIIPSETHINAVILYKYFMSANTPTKGNYTDLPTILVQNKFCEKYGKAKAFINNTISTGLGVDEFDSLLKNGDFKPVFSILYRICKTYITARNSRYMDNQGVNNNQHKFILLDSEKILTLLSIVREYRMISLEHGNLTGNNQLLSQALIYLNAAIHNTKNAAFNINTLAKHARKILDGNSANAAQTKVSRQINDIMQAETPLYNVTMNTKKEEKKVEVFVTNEPVIAGESELRF